MLPLSPLMSEILSCSALLLGHANLSLSLRILMLLQLNFMAIKLKVLDPGTSTSQVVHADRLKKIRDALSPLAEPLTSLSSDSSTSSASPPVRDPPPVTSVSPSDYYRQKLRSAHQLRDPPFFPNLPPFLTLSQVGKLICV